MVSLEFFIDIILLAPIVWYGAESWMMTKKEEQALLIFERKIFRIISGPKYENGEWKSRTNRELKEMNKGENLVKWIKGQRIRWLGHLERMGKDRMPQKIFTQELQGMRRRGRPRKGWKEEVERDFQVLGVRRCRELVTDRKKMEGYCSTGQSLQRAVVPMEKKKNPSGRTMAQGSTQPLTLMSTRNISWG
jgi:hypothetical protein